MSEMFCKSERLNLVYCTTSGGTHCGGRPSVSGTPNRTARSDRTDAWEMQEMRHVHCFLIPMNK